MNRENPLNKPTPGVCFRCNKPIYPNQAAVYSAVTDSFSIHKKCWTEEDRFKRGTPSKTTAFLAIAAGMLASGNEEDDNR